MRKRRGRKLSEQSLAIIRAIGDGLTDFVDVMTTLNPGEYQSGAYRVRYNPSYDPTYKRVYELRRNKYVTVKKKDNKSFYRLTPKGRFEFLKLLHLEKIFKTKWDGRWRVVIFDIPEKERQRRDYLRKKLKELRFVYLQESVYITPHPLTSELDQMLSDGGMTGCFRFLTVAEIDGEADLKKKFGLK